MTGRLLVIVPTRGRPGNIARLWQAWQATTSGRADLLVAVDGDASNMPAYAATGAPWLTHTGWQGMVATLNQRAVEHAADYQAVAFWGDDHVPRTPGWDARLLNALDELGRVGIVYGNDLHRGEDLPTAVAMTSTIVQALGYMAPPDLGHLVCDRWWLKLGRRLDRIRYLPDVVIEHMHYAAGKAAKDAGYRVVNAPTQYRADWAAYHRYVNRGHLRRDVELLRAVAEGRTVPAPQAWTEALPGLLATHGVRRRGVVQVGAHRGEEVDVFRRMGFAPIVLVEPNPALAAALRDLDGVDVVEAACGAAAGTGRLHVTETTKYTSLFVPARKAVAKTIDVPVRRLADVVDPRVNVAVVDVQGAELQVVDGAPLDQLDLIVLETHTKPMYVDAPLHDQVMAVMGRRGWRPVGEFWHDVRGRARDVAFVKAAR